MKKIPIVSAVSEILSFIRTDNVLLCSMFMEYLLYKRAASNVLNMLGQYNNNRATKSHYKLQKNKEQAKTS